MTQTQERPTKQRIHMNTAFLWAQRATCKQKNRKIGCIITDFTLDRVLAIAYNGPPTAMPNDSCRNIPGNCGCVHAEANAIARMDSTVPHKIMFITMVPCEHCANLIAQSNIAKVYYYEEYRGQEGLRRLRACGVETIQVHTGEILQVLR